jgi:PAS domain S-box-containing protein
VRRNRGLAALLGALAIAAGAATAAADEPQAPPAGGPTTQPLIIGVFDDRAPYLVRDPAGNAGGFDAGVARAMARTMNVPIGFRILTAEETVPALLRSEVDAVAGVTPRRYTQPVFINKMRLFVHQETVFIHTLKDLKGVRVGVNRGVDTAEFLKLVPGVELVPEPDTASAFRDLVDRRIAVYFGDENEAQHYIRVQNLAGIKTVGGALILKRRCFAVRKGNRELLARLNNAIDGIKRDFTLQAVQDEWFGRPAFWGYYQRRFLMLLLAVLGLVATVLLVTLVWNQKLADAVSQRTQELAAEREHFQNIFDHASDGILVVNPEDTSLMEMNRAFEDITGVAKEELVGRELRLLDASEEASLDERLRQVVEIGGSTMFEARIRTKSNRLVDLLIHARPFPFRGRTMVEAIVRDVTERKKVQEMKDTILQDVAHELKTPMSKMAMSIDLLERNLSKEHGEAYGKFFEICHRSIRRLQHTIEGILNLSRLESEALKMSMDVFALQDILMAVIDELYVFAQRKGLHVLNEFDREPILVHGDSEMVTRLFINLIHNAIKFTDRGSIIISAAKDARFAKVSVKDNGIGLEEEDLKKIFGRFYQKTPTYEGCGIGLTIAQKIVALHNGVIWAESEGLGKGTTMNVMFPLYRHEAPRPAAKTDERNQAA